MHSFQNYFCVKKFKHNYEVTPYWKLDTSGEKASFVDIEIKNK